MLLGKTKILIVGAGKKGSLLVNVFHKSRAVDISGVVDVYPDAPGIKLAEELGIPTSTEYKDFLNIEGLNEIINVTGSEKVQQELLEIKTSSLTISITLCFLCARGFLYLVFTIFSLFRVRQKPPFRLAEQ